MKDMVIPGILVLSSLLLIAAFILLNNPDNYTLLFGIPADFGSNERLVKLSRWNIIASIVHIFVCVFLITTVESPLMKDRFTLGSFIVTWCIFAFVNPRLNKPQNAYPNGHFILFLSLMAILAGHIVFNLNYFNEIPDSIDIKQGCVYIQLIIIMGQFLVLGSWSNRNEMDDVDNVKRDLNIDFL